MILAIKNWCEGIIIAIIISIIVELLLPDGNNKKYVKVVSGIYIMFVVLNPILEILKYDISFENLFQVENVETYSNLDENMQEVYVIGMEETIKNEIEELGYEVESVNVKLDANYENIEKIEMKVSEKENRVKIIKPIKIGEENQKSNFEYVDIINHLKENYFVEKEKIIFLES